ncbi:hypothetical protein QEW_4490 [Clostridioides difficile CD160]|nr:hypothetical protein QEW_4490 [Clostridioides difficile CD160]
MDISNLDYISNKVYNLLNTSKCNIEDARHTIISTMIKVLDTTESDVSNLLLHARKNDIKYINLLKNMYPKLNLKDEQFDLSYSEDYELLTNSFAKGAIKLYWDELLKKHISIDDIKKYAKNYTTLIYPIEDEFYFKIKEILNGDNTIEGLDNMCKLFESIKDDITNNNKEYRKTDYILELKKQGYDIVTNDTLIAGNKNLHTEIIEILESVYEPSKVTKNGQTFDIANMSNKSLLENINMNYQTANLWSADVYTKDEDLAFRVFVKEDDTSFRVRVKIPLHLGQFRFVEKKNLYLSQSKKEFKCMDAVNEMKLIPALFSNSNPDYGDLYTSSFFEMPTVTSFKGFGIDSIYNCVQFVIVKSLVKFKQELWPLRDYIKQAKGIETDTVFKDFKNLPLGKKIVPGVIPGGLFSLEFRNDRNQSACLMCGGAGSGKTAMLYSLAIQHLALEDVVQGLGAIVLIDAKMELPRPWIKAFKNFGIQLYGFDAEKLPENELKKEVVNRRGEKEVVPIGTPIPGYIAGLVFIKCVFYAIQDLLNKFNSDSGTDFIDFNKSNISIEDVLHIPRTAVIVDELNLMKSSLDKFDNGRGQKIFSDSIPQAKSTRTSGLGWILCGQDLSKSIIPANERSNYPYSIVGELSEERYAYYGINPNVNVLKYEDLNCPDGDKDKAIMGQGVFYAGSSTSNSLVKCMYLPINELNEALNDLNTSFDGMKQFENIVKYAIKNGFFEDANNPFGEKTNMVYCALKNIGAISQEEFEMYTNKMFNTKTSAELQENENILDEFTNIDYNKLNSTQFKENLALNNNLKTNNIVENNLNNLLDDIDSTKIKDTSNNEYNKELNTDDSNLKQKDAIDENYIRSMYRKQASDIQNDAEMKPNKFMNCLVYNDELKIETNPFELGLSNTILGSLYPFGQMFKIITKEIKRVYGSLDRIEILVLSSGNGVFINKTAFRPSLPENVIDSLPFDIRDKVRSGNIIDFFDLRLIPHLKELSKLIVEDGYFAYTRLKKEIGMGKKEHWSNLYDYCESLIYLEIDGEEIGIPLDQDETEDEECYKHKFQEKIKRAMGMEDFNQQSDISPLGRIWSSKPMKTVGSAVGYTVGIKSAFVLATIFGGWGLVFSAFAGYNVYKNYIKKDKK